MNKKYSYTFIVKIVILIIGIYICYPIVNKYLNKMLGIKEGLIEGFTWSKDTTNKFNIYQNTVNLNNSQYNMSVLQEQASEDEAKELLKTGYWPWSEDTKKQYMEGIWQNTMLKFDPEAALDYAMKLYNESAAKKLLSWNTKEGQFLLYGSNTGTSGNIIGIDSHGNGISDAGQIAKKSVIKCSEDSNPVLQKTTINSYNLFNGFKNTTTTNIDFKDIPNEVPGFTFVNGECNPCAPLNDVADYSCPFKLNVKGNNEMGNNEISDVWKNLWSV
jgi:hypothetical protein